MRIKFNDNLKKLSDLISQYMELDTVEKNVPKPHGEPGRARFVRYEGESKSYTYVSDGNTLYERILYSEVPTDEEIFKRENPTSIDIRLTDTEFKVFMRVKPENFKSLSDLAELITEYNPDVNRREFTLSFAYEVKQQTGLKAQLESFETFFKKYMEQTSN